MLLTPQRHLALKHQGPCGDCRGDSGALGISPDDSVGDEGEIHLLLSKGLEESPRKVTGWCSRGMLAQPKFPEDRTIGHQAYWGSAISIHLRAMSKPCGSFLLSVPNTEKREGGRSLTEVSSMLPSNKEPYIHPEQSFFLLSTKVRRGLSLLPKLLTKISQQCVSLAFLNPIDDNKVS